MRKNFRKQDDGGNVALFFGIVGAIAAIAIAIDSRSTSKVTSKNPQENLTPDIQKISVLKEPIKKPPFPSLNSQVSAQTEEGKDKQATK